MGRQFKQHVYGGVYIPVATGLTNLYDLITEEDTLQDLVDQAITDTATLFIKLNLDVDAFLLKSVSVGYSDGANADDLANLYLIEKPNAEDSVQAARTRYVSGGIAEALLDHDPVERPIRLDEAGKLYFITDWTTAVINCGGAGEFLYIRVDGETMDGF